MTAYIIRRLLLIVPTLIGIMIINFAVVQVVPGGPVEQMIANMTGTAVESTARFSGSNENESLNNFDTNNYDSKYRGAKGLDPDIIKEIEEILGYDKLDIEFAVDKADVIHIFQIRPITVGHTEFEIEKTTIKESIENAFIKYNRFQKNTPFIFETHVLDFCVLET